MSEYGAPFDLRKLPGPMFRAHLAIIEGKRQREADEQEDAEVDADHVQQQARRW